MRIEILQNILRLLKNLAFVFELIINPSKVALKLQVPHLHEII